jgi:hypothetical protein
VTIDQKVIKTKVGLLELARPLGNVWKRVACWGTAERVSTGSRSCTKQAAKKLREISRRKPVHQNRVAPDVEAACIEVAIAQPALGQVRMANDSPSGD